MKKIQKSLFLVLNIGELISPKWLSCVHDWTEHFLMCGNTKGNGIGSMSQEYSDEVLV